MASAFAQQLRQIAAKSTNELDLRARRERHADSLIFERSVAVRQDWETLYQICIEGFQELCLLDGRFKDFERNLFGYNSKDQDREQLNKSQNEDLDSVIEQCLQLLGSRLTLRPGIKALEWLVRRFRIHVYNAGALLLTVLPYHEVRLFQNVLSIIPTTTIVDEWKFLRPYQLSPSIVPRHAIVYTATTNNGFLSALNKYSLDTCQNGVSSSVWFRFWSSIVVEAVAAKLKLARSGRKEIQRQRVEDVFLKIIPVINDGLSLENCPDMTIACFTLILVMVSTGLLEDATINSFMQAIALTLTYPSMDINQTLVCLSVLATHSEEVVVSGRVVNAIAKLDDPVSRLQNIKHQYPISSLLQSLVQGALTSMKQKDMGLKITFLEKILKARPPLCEDPDLIQLLMTIFSHLQRLDQQDTFASSIASRLKAMLQELFDSNEHRNVFSQLESLCRERGIEMEVILEATVPALEDTKPALEPMEVDATADAEEDLERAIAELPTSLHPQESFLTAAVSPTFEKLLHILKLCQKDEDGPARFVKLELWKRSRSSSMSSPYIPYLSFLLRLVCGHYDVSLKAFATSLLADYIHQKERVRVDSQFILPYAAILLANPSSVVRRKAANLILAMEKAAPTRDVDLGSDECESINIPLYQDGRGIPLFEPLYLVKILRQVFIPTLEEYVSDGNQIRLDLQQILNGDAPQHQSPAKPASVELKKPYRIRLFECLLNCALANPLLRVKSEIINLLDGVLKVGSTNKNETLSPILREWIALTPEDSERRAQTEEMSVAAVDRMVTQLILARDPEAITRIVRTMEEQKLQPRPDLITALFDRIASTWSTAKTDRQQSLSIELFNLSFSETPIFARGARSTLKKVSLSTNCLLELIEQSLAATKRMQDDVSPHKRRKVNHGDSGSSPVQHPGALTTDIPRIVLTLELVDGSAPQARPELMPGLFDVLVVLRRLRTPLQSESPYALGLCLNNLLAIVDAANKSRKPNLEMSSIRADMVIDCVRGAESPQVQSDALMLAASLAGLAPDRVIHHIMPVFAFMGNNMLSLDNGHSVNVINQAIDRIIPPLVAKLKQQDEGSLIRSTHGLLSTFVAAFDHIPQHRRVSLYQRLLRRLGSEDFGFALLAMLAVTKSASRSRHDFLVNVMSEFSPSQQLITYSRIVSLVADIYADKPHNTESLLHIDSSSSPADRSDAALSLFSLAESLLRSKHLRSQISKRANSTNEPDQMVREELTTCLHQILEAVRMAKPYGEDMTNSVRMCMTALLELFSLAQLIRILPSLLEAMDHHDKDLKPEALYVLAAQMRGKVPNDADTIATAVAYLSDLEEIMKMTDSNQLKGASIACINNIAEKYGRKDVDSIVRAAAVLASEAGLVASDASVQLQSALTLSSMFDIAGEAAIPLVSKTMVNALALIESSFEEDHENPQLHDAAFTLISAIVSNVPFMISEEHLDRTFALAAEAAFSDLPDSCIEIRQDALSYLARKIDLSTLITSVTNTWDKVIENDIDAVLPTLDMCIAAIEHNSKSNVVKAADTISTFVLKVLDLRRLQFTARDEESYYDDEVAQVGRKLNDLALKFIYKLNDNVFRPVFESWVDWGVKCHDLSAEIASNPRTTLLRQTSLFMLLTHFFGTLKSIVTSYAAYIIAPANTILENFSAKAANKFSIADATASDGMLLYSTLLSLLRETYLHDTDAFFTSPSHFQPLCTHLLAQLQLAAHKPFRPLIDSHVIPCIVALATAIQDTPAHHMTINHHLAQLRHSDSSAVRLASIRTHIAITEEEDVGDEWVNTVVSGTAQTEVGGEPGVTVTGRASVGGSGETMIYVNEMLEDDDEEVEGEVRRWVRMVRERVGEDVFEF